MRLTVRVQPGARQTRVGGRYGDDEPPVIVVRVTAPAVDGGADLAVIDALASALGVRRSGVHIVSGQSARTKVVDVAAADAGAVERLLARWRLPARRFA